MAQNAKLTGVRDGCSKTGPGMPNFRLFKKRALRCMQNSTDIQFQKAKVGLLIQAKNDKVHKLAGMFYRCLWKDPSNAVPSNFPSIVN